MTPRQSLSDKQMRLEEALVYLDAFGAARARWPASSTALFDEFSDDLRFASARVEAATLDEALGLSAAPGAGEALKEKILSSYAAPPSASGLFARFARASRGGVGRLVPAGALAGLSALGFAAGAASTGVGAGAAESDPLYYAQATLTVAANEEDAFWAVD